MAPRTTPSFYVTAEGAIYLRDNAGECELTEDNGPVGSSPLPAEGIEAAKELVQELDTFVGDKTAETCADWLRSYIIG